MYDALRARYTFGCPTRGEAHVSLSSFRTLDRLEGTAHPVVFRVRFQCTCGEEHDGLVAHGELDWAPLGLEQHVAFVDLMTSTVQDVAVDLADVAARRIQAGEWPWSFFCYPEERPRPIFPSSFSVLAPGGTAIGLAARCPVCSKTSVNLVSRQHVDMPFHNDSHVGVVEHLFLEDALKTLEEFRTELYSAHFDVRRLGLE
jgi:hypothetical protein